ncbi:hypothetical protein EVAR_49031_1 [Eumeta japonica]|uniref:Uncharacterized protein n=1 Tax=Eumeta variegata TaxID=151549 RepID=A0A4C1XN33_EUMVA|nr:hypothetical protein EVAR_49031_1 [Eumeta japonica]
MKSERHLSWKLPGRGARGDDIKMYIHVNIYINIYILNIDVNIEHRAVLPGLLQLGNERSHLAKGECHRKHLTLFIPLRVISTSPMTPDKCLRVRQARQAGHRKPSAVSVKPSAFDRFLQGVEKHIVANVPPQGTRTNPVVTERLPFYPDHWRAFLAFSSRTMRGGVKNYGRKIATRSRRPRRQPRVVNEDVEWDSRSAR